MNINRYIHKATAGLPSKERIDTSAELRVHLNAQVKKYLLEGHSQEEAEYLAVDAMGAPAPVNRQLLGHVFTPRVGWGLVIATVLGFSSWWLWTNQALWWNKSSPFSSFNYSSDTFAGFNITTLKLIPGQGIQGIRWAITYRGKILGGSGQFQDKTKRLEPVVLHYNPSSQFTTKYCPSGGFLVNGQTYCSKDYSGYFMGIGYGGQSSEIRSNRWIPTYNTLTRAGAQSATGTKEACVLWVMFINPDLPLAEPDPPLIFRPYADYFKNQKP